MDPEHKNSCVLMKSYWVHLMALTSISRQLKALPSTVTELPSTKNLLKTKKIAHFTSTFCFYQSLNQSQRNKNIQNINMNDKMITWMNG